jgi:Ca2+-binding EF-hand superfamily protein
MAKLLTSTALVLAMSVAGTAIGTAQAADRQASGQCPDHFASLDSNSDSKITQEEERSVRNKIFSNLDQDKNDVVSRSEYVNCLISTPAFSAAATAKGSKSASANAGQSSLLGISDSRSTDQFKKVDANGNGKISWSEYADAAKGEKPAKSGNAAPAPASAGWAFTRMDSDGDGTLTQQEWTHLGEARTTAENSFKSLDANGDGQVSRQEYQSRQNRSFESGMNDKSNSAQNSQQASEDMDIWDYDYWM